MTEEFLHFLWRFNLIRPNHLFTEEGQEIRLIKAGDYNQDAGPDFQHAQLFIDDVQWVGQVEMHLNSSDWYAHKHQNDSAYNNVILHVVWRDDKPVKNREGQTIPTLVLERKVPKQLISKYQAIQENKDELPCSHFLSSVERLVKISMLDRVVMERLTRKADEIYDAWEKNGKDWRQTFYQVLLKGFGFKVNKAAMSYLADALPISVLLKHRDQLIELEALLLGTAGLLDGVEKDDYHRDLKKVYEPLARKFQLIDRKLEVVNWKYSKLRPPNFPEVRLVQFAALIHSHGDMFQTVFEMRSAGDVKLLFRLPNSQYWQKHYRLGVAAPSKLSGIGSQSINILCLNTVVPMMVAYGKHKGVDEFANRALEILESMPGEDNTIVRSMTVSGFTCNSALDSQGLLELKSQYCQKKKCLDCQIGVSVLKDKSSLSVS